MDASVSDSRKRRKDEESLERRKRKRSSFKPNEELQANGMASLSPVSVRSAPISTQTSGVLLFRYPKSISVESRNHHFLRMVNVSEEPSSSWDQISTFVRRKWPELINDQISFTCQMGTYTISIDDANDFRDVVTLAISRTIAGEEPLVLEVQTNSRRESSVDIPLAKIANNKAEKSIATPTSPKKPQSSSKSNTTKDEKAIKLTEQKPAPSATPQKVQKPVETKPTQPVAKSKKPVSKAEVVKTDVKFSPSANAKNTKTKAQSPKDIIPEKVDEPMQLSESQTTAGTTSSQVVEPVQPIIPESAKTKKQTKKNANLETDSKSSFDTDAEDARKVQDELGLLSPVPVPAPAPALVPVPTPASSSQEEKKRKAQEEKDKKKAEADEKQRQKEEIAKQKAEEKAKKAAEVAAKKEEQAAKRKAAAEEKERKKAEIEAKKAEEEAAAKQKAEEEAKKKLEEEKKKQEEEEAAKKRKEDDEKKKKELEEKEGLKSETNSTSEPDSDEEESESESDEESESEESSSDSDSDTDESSEDIPAVPQNGNTITSPKKTTNGKVESTTAKPSDTSSSSHFIGYPRLASLNPALIKVNSPYTNGVSAGKKQNNKSTQEEESSSSSSDDDDDDDDEENEQESSSDESSSSEDEDDDSEEDQKTKSKPSIPDTKKVNGKTSSLPTIKRAGASPAKQEKSLDKDTNKKGKKGLLSKLHIQ